MHWRARVVAPVLAAVLGVTGGALAATLTGTSTGTSPTQSFADPEHLGVPLQNLTCTGDYVLVVAHGDGLSALGNGVAGNRSAGVRYLQTAKSCDARLGPDRDADPELVAYLGPYPTATEPCQMRMSGAKSSALVAVLTAGSSQPIKCPCVLPISSAPTLDIASKPTDVDNIWARALQTMLRDYAVHEGQSLTGDKAPPKVTGTYDEVTRRYVLDRFQTPAGYLGRNGVLDTETWNLVTRRICPIYDESS